MISEIWRITSIEMNSFLRAGVSLVICPWLAISIRGSSQDVRIRRGVDSWSVKNRTEKLWQVSLWV